jgi:uncharacterized protein YkwD
MFSAIVKISTTLVLLLEVSAESSTPKVELHPVERGIIEGTNAQRARYGLPALEIDPALEASARGHAAWMTNHNSLQHTSAAVGENIAWGQQSTEEAVTDWMNSSGHRANILDPSYHKIGAAAYTASDGSIYWCQQFLR